MGIRLDNQLQNYWDDRRRDNSIVAATGFVTVARNQGRYQVVAPFDVDFNLRIKALGARWRHRSKCWSVPTSQRSQLRQLITDCFGAEKVPQELRD